MRAFLLTALLASTASPGRADLVVFSSGHVLRVESYRVVGAMAVTELASGEMRFPLTLVDRVVGDEVDSVRPATPMPVVEPPEQRTVEPEPTAAPEQAQSIAGNVLDEAGDPVEGIELVARAIRLFEAGGETGESLSEARTRTDPFGTYRLGPLAGGEYGVRTLPTDRYTAARTVVRTGVDFANLVVSQKREVAIYGTVTNTEGDPLEAVSVRQVERSKVAATTDRDGSYRLRLPVGGRGQNRTLKYELDGYGDWTFPLADSQVSSRDEIQVDARLEPLESVVGVEGRVTSTAGAPVVGETIFLVGEEHHQAITDQAGGFSIVGIDAHATYKLWVSPRGPYQKYNETVQVGAGVVAVEIVLEPEGSEYASLSGRMVDAGGSPVPGFNLWVRSSTGSTRRPLLVTSDASGYFSAPRAPVGRLVFTTVSEPRLTISGPELPPDGAEGVELILDAGGHEIRGRVLDGYGSPVAGPQLTLEWSHRAGALQSLSLRRSTADANGFFAFTQVGPGPHSLSVSAPGFRSTQLQAEPQRDLVVELQPNGRQGALGGQ